MCVCGAERERKREGETRRRREQEGGLSNGDESRRIVEEDERQGGGLMFRGMIKKTSGDARISERELQNCYGPELKLMMTIINYLAAPASEKSILAFLVRL